MDLSLIEDSGMAVGLSPENDNEAGRGLNHAEDHGEAGALALQRMMW